MKNWKRVLCIICVLACCLCGCAKKQENYLREGLYCNVPNVPRIEKFSGKAYEKYEYHFSPVESAVYVYNGTEIAIEADDPRLIRLLNFLAYSDEKDLSWWLQGYEYEDEINVFLASDVPRLEVNFIEEPLTFGSALEKTPKIIICGDTFLLYTREPGPDGTERADRRWPYAELYMKWADKEKVDERNRLSSKRWGTDCWIDLLVYAGFTKPSEGDVP